MTPSTHEALVRARKLLIESRDSGPWTLAFLDEIKATVALIDAALLPDPKEVRMIIEPSPAHPKVGEKVTVELNGETSVATVEASFKPEPKADELTVANPAYRRWWDADKDDPEGYHHKNFYSSAYYTKPNPKAGGAGLVPMDVARAGFALWAGKAHNAKWLRKIDGTPIPNDLIVNMAEAFRTALSSPAKASGDAE